MPHIHELIDFTVNVFIVFEDKVLLRFHDKYHFWGGSASGHIELNETPVDAVLRETIEEVGLEIEIYEVESTGFISNDRVKKLIPPIYQDIHKINETHKHIGMIYFARSKNNKVNPQSSEDRSDTWKWVNIEELEKMDMWEEQKFYARKALELLSSKWPKITTSAA